MKFDLIEFLTNPFVPLFLATVTGLLIGRVKIGKFSFGQSGGLFTGIFFGWALYARYCVPFMIDPNDSKKGLIEGAPKYAADYLQNGVVSSTLFNFTLILFIAAVGLLAGKDIGKVIKKYGGKFIILGGLISGTGALMTYLATLVFTGQNPFAVAGVYTGALTSSPALAAALESTAKYGVEAQAQVGLGHAIGYAPGVLVVIIAMNFFPVIFKMDLEKEKEKFKVDMKSFDGKGDNEKEIKEVGMDIVSFILVCLLGYLLGSINIYLPFIKWFSLGSTGGVLIMALWLGHIGKIGPLTFRMDTKVLNAIRDLTLSLFLAIVGLKYGYETVASLGGSGAELALISFGAGLIALLVGFCVARYIFKMNWIIIAGAICGGMTSTPGLGAAIDATGTDEVAAGYGATYPFGLLCTVIFVIILHMVA
jgi:putative transport protein